MTLSTFICLFQCFSKVTLDRTGNAFFLFFFFLVNYLLVCQGCIHYENKCRKSFFTGQTPPTVLVFSGHFFPSQVGSKVTEAQKRAKERAVDAKKIQDLERQVSLYYLNICGVIFIILQPNAKCGLKDIRSSTANIMSALSAAVLLPVVWLVVCYMT